MKTFSIHKRALVISTMLTASFLLLIFHSISYGSNELNPSMEESEYVEFLDTAATLTKANYESIVNWQGEIRIQEDNYYYGEQCRHLPIAEGVQGAGSNCIRRRVTGFEEFVIDMNNNKLYTELVPTVKYRALDLNQDIVVNERYSPIKSIVTSDEYLSYEPLYMHAFDTLKNGKKFREHTKAAFRMPVEKAKGEQWGNVRDPRKYFSQGARTTSENLYAIRSVVTNDVNSAIGSHFDISITEEKASDRTKYTIQNRIRSLIKKDIDIIMTLDSSVGFNLTSRKVVDSSGKTLQTLNFAYEEIKGVYLPKSIHFVIFSPFQQKLFDSRITFTKSILNVWNESIPTETFTYKNLGLQNGDKFIDKIQDKEYTYQDGNLIEDKK